MNIITNILTIAVLEAPNAAASVFIQIGVPLKHKYAMKLSDDNFVQQNSVKISACKQTCRVQLNQYVAHMTPVLCSE
jgi:hypothetical protein